MAGSYLSLIPPLLAIGLVILTRKVLLSLGAGIVAGLALLNGFDVLAGARQLVDIVVGIFVADGALNTEKVFNLVFLLFLGMAASLITACGGSRAFGAWAVRRIQRRRGAGLLAAVLGVVVFIDDYFNALVVGNVSRPVTDRHRISRAKLAYLVDSTSAPVCVIMPISSWGAYIVSIIAGILSAHGMHSVGSLEAFVRTIPVNYYAIIAVIMVLCVAFFGLDFGPMRRHESGALDGADPGALADDPAVDEPDSAAHGRIRDLVLPIAVLVVGTIGGMLITGAQASGSGSPLVILENTDVPTSLLAGSTVGWLVALVLARRRSTPRIGRSHWAGIKSMLPAIWILLFAWTTIDVIDDLGTGEYLAGLVSGSLSPAVIPLLVFLICGFMSISTGTSWGTFGIMLPIAGQIAVATDPGMLFPVMGAVLAGAIWGDHCSPISDTTIMSSAGAQCRHIDHVLTQLPYALVIAGISAAGYLVLGLTGSGVFGLVVSLALLAVMVAGVRLMGEAQPSVPAAATSE